MRIFTVKDLAQYNGKNGKPAYIAYKRKVYDLTHSFLWKDGRHQVFHSAGTDLTTAIEQAPHSGKVLARFPVVGILQEAGTRGSNEAKTRKRKPIQRASGKRQVTVFLKANQLNASRAKVHLSSVRLSYLGHFFQGSMRLQ